MKSPLSATSIIIVFLAIILQGCREIDGCKDRSATNYDSDADNNCCCTYPAPPPPAVENGALLFWTSDLNLISNCGAMTITLNTGQTSIITGYYFVAPTNCVNSFGGYFYLPVGTYSYSYSTPNSACTFAGGEVVVVNGCNRRNVQ